MDVLRYIFSIKSSSQQFTITETLLVTLAHFTRNRPSSVWDVFKAVRSSNDKISYKNVRAKVRKLLSAHMIQREKKPLEFHGSIYYKLTPFGIFYILGHNDIFGSYILNDLIKNYGDDEIFRIFVCPCFKIETLQELWSDSVRKEILNFYLSLCKTIEWGIESINEFTRHKGIQYSVGFWNEIAYNSDVKGIGREQEGFAIGLKFNLGINWLGNKVKFELVDKNILKISKGKNSLILELNEKGGTLSVFEDGKEIICFQIDPMMNDLHIVYFIPISEQSFLQNLRANIDTEIQKLIEKLAFSLIPYAKQHFLLKSDEKNLQHDLRILAADAKFTKLLGYTKSRFVSHYDRFRKYKVGTYS